MGCPALWAIWNNICVLIAIAIPKGNIDKASIIFSAKAMIKSNIAQSPK